MKELLKIISIFLVIYFISLAFKSNKPSFSITDEQRDSILVEVWDSDIIFDSNDFQYRIEIDNDGNNVYDLIEEKVKCYFPNVPIVNKLKQGYVDFRVYSYADTLTSLISTLNIADFSWPKKEYNAIYLAKDTFLKGSVNQYLDELYRGYDYTIEIMEKIKFNQKYDGYSYQVTLSDEYCHKGLLFLVAKRVYHINVKGMCEAKPLLNYTHSLMHHTLEFE